MRPAEGKNVLLKVYKGGIANAVACNTSCSLTMDTDDYETTFLNTGAFRTWIPNKTTVVVEGSGPIFLAAPVTAADVLTWQFNRSIVQFDFTMSEGNDLLRVSGIGYFLHSKISGDVNQFATCDYTIKVNGAITIYSVNNSVGAGDVEPYDKDDFEGGEVDFADPVLENVQLLHLSRSGVGIEIIPVGVPNASQALFEPSLGKITFGTPLATNEWVHGIYQVQ